MSNKFHDAMELVAELNKSHGVTQRGGKQYTEVAKRVEAFRVTFGGTYGIDTEVLHNDGKTVIVKATIRDESGFIVGSGLAEEIRGSSNITKTSAVEVCETSAIGRALASLGLHGGQYASSNEIDGVKRKEQAIQSQAKTPDIGIDLEARIDALLQFYENCDAEAFAKAEGKYKNVLNNRALTEEQYNQVVEAHDKRKVEIMV